MDVLDTARLFAAGTARAAVVRAGALPFEADGTAWPPLSLSAFALWK